MDQKCGLWLWLGLVCLLSAAIVGCGRPPAAGPPQSADKDAGPEVLVGQPVVQTITDYEDFLGHIEALLSIEIRARVSGYLVKGLRDGESNKEGTEVKQGDLLFEIDPRHLRGRQEQGRGRVAQSQARVERLAKDVKRAEELLPNALDCPRGL